MRIGIYSANMVISAFYLQFLLPMYRNLTKATLSNLNVYIFNILLILGFLHSHVANAATTPLEISERLQTASVVIVGWSHSPVNTIVPNFIRNELEQNVSRYPLSLVIESAPETFSVESLIASERPLVEEAIRLNIPVIPGDLYNEKLKSMGILELLLLDQQEINRRNRQFERVILDQVKGGRKVILLIGSGHVEDLTRMLQSDGIVVSSAVTSWDFKSRKVEMNGQLLGITERDKGLEATDALLAVLSREHNLAERAIFKIFDLGEAFIGKTRQICAKILRPTKPDNNSAD